MFSDLCSKILLITVFVVVVSSERVSSQDVTSTNLPKNNLRCGGILTGSSGGISYKAFEQFDNYERCVWIIRAPNATWYEVTTRNLGQAGSVILTGLGLRDKINQTIAAVSPDGRPQIIPYSNVLLVTFYTGYNERQRGFSLEYISKTGGEYGSEASNPASADSIVADNFGVLKHPRNTDTYGNLELTVLVFAPKNSIYSNKNHMLIYTRHGMDADCRDTIIVFMFNTTSDNPHKWERRGSVCGGIESESITHNDLMLLLFETNESEVGTGFTIGNFQCS